MVNLILHYIVFNIIEYCSGWDVLCDGHPVKEIHGFIYDTGQILKTLLSLSRYLLF